MKLLFATLALLGVSLVAGCKQHAPDAHPPIGPGAPKPDAAGTGAAAPASTVQLPERAHDTLCDGAACLPDIDYAMWGGYVAPLGTPREAITTLNRALNLALKDPAIIELYKRFGLEPVGGTPEELTRIINNEYNAYAKLIRETGLKLE